MAGLKLRWTIGGSIILAATTGVLAIAEEPPIPQREAAIIEQPELMPPTADEPLIGPSASVVVVQSVPEFAPQYQPVQPRRFEPRYSRFRSRYWGYPQEFCDLPLGAVLQGQMMAQVANGQAARMALYQYDFQLASDRLNASGRAQLAKIARWLPMNDFPLFVEPTSANPELDERRRQMVWQELSNHQISIPLERILLGRPNVRGLDASDAISIDRNRQGLTFSRGISSGGGTSGSTTSTTSQGSTTPGSPSGR